MLAEKPKKFLSVFKFMSVALTVLALPPSSTIFLIKKNRVISISYQLYALIAEMLVWTTAVRICGALFVSNQEHNVIEIVTGILYLVQLQFRYLVLVLKRKSLESYVTFVENLEYVTGDNDAFLELFNKNHKRVYQLGSKMLTFEFVFSIFGFIVAPKVFGLKKNNSALIYPFNDYHPAIVEIYQIIDAFSICFVSMRPTAISLLSVALMVFHITQQEFLKNELRYMLENYEKDGNDMKRLSLWAQKHQKSLE